MRFALASKSIKTSHEAPCERHKVPAALVFTVSVLGWTAYNMGERGMASSKRLRRISSLLTPRLNCKKPVPAEGPAIEPGASEVEAVEN